MLADAFRQAIEANLGEHAGLTSRVLVKAEDTGETFTFWVEDGELRLEEGEAGGAQIRILGDSEAILALTRLEFRPGDDALQLVLKRQLGGELTVRGLVLRPRQVLRLLRLLAMS